MAVGQAIGILPVCFMIGGPRLALRAIGVVAALTVIVELIASRKPQPSMSTATPQPRHYVFAAAGASFHGLVAGYMWLGIYWMIAALIWLPRAIFGWPDVADVWAAATTPSIVLALPMAVAALVQGHRELTEQLCPNRAGVDTVFETGSLSPRALWAFTLAVLGIGVLLLAAALLQYQMSWTVAIGVLFAIMMTSVPLATISSTDARPVVRDVIDATKRGLEKAGYEVLSAPRTGDASVDPLLADLSLYVRTPDRRGAFAIDIKASPTDQPLDWSAASSLTLKCSALASVEAREAGSGTSAPIVPVLVTLTPVDSSLYDFAQDHHVMVFDLDAAARATDAGKTATSRAIVRGAAQRAPELIRDFIERGTRAATAVSSSGDGKSGGAVAPA